jgi:serine/threonine protein kinase
MMVRCNSPYLAKCFDVFRNNDLKIIVMEFCNRGTLTKYIEEKNTLPED